MKKIKRGILKIVMENKNRKIVPKLVSLLDTNDINQKLTPNNSAKN